MLFHVMDLYRDYFEAGIAAYLYLWCYSIVIFDIHTSLTQLKWIVKLHEMIQSAILRYIASSALGLTR